MDKNTFWKKLQNYAKKYMNQRQSLLFRYAQVCINCTKLGRKSIKIECHHRLKHFKLSDCYSFAFICFPLHPLFPYVVFLKNIFRAMLFFLSSFVFYSLCDKYCCTCYENNTQIQWNDLWWNWKCVENDRKILKLPSFRT